MDLIVTFFVAIEFIDQLGRKIGASKGDFNVILSPKV